ncbi:MAG: hypothetical protein NTW10_04495 [Bacteroidetes bacterium]|nr:hypothetical protein [Bacteroidota bacterium]
MKTTIVTRTILIALLVGFISVISAYAASPAAISAKNIRQKLVEAVMNPEDMTTLPSTGEAEVLFKLNDEGTIDIRKIDATNEDIASFVKTTMANVPCKDFVHPYNQYYKVKFRFTQN